VTLKTVGVKNIGENAFYGSTQLKKIEFDGSLTTIEACAFEDCKMLKDITFGSGLKTIKDDAFSMCYVLKTVDMVARWVGVKL
jgi:hypothetical protein